MEHFEIAKALNHLLPNAMFVLSGDTVDGIDWLDERPLPSEIEIKNAIKVVKANEIAQAQAKATAKVAAEGKLAALGLTTDDLRALGL
jgi:hypothetical protein